LARNVTEIFCFNLCEACLLATTPDVTKTAHNGDAIYDANEDMPLTCYSDFGRSLRNPLRDQHIIERCAEAREAVLYYAKLRRNKVRVKPCKVDAYKNQVCEGQYLSWGFGDTQFDEYYGEVAPVFHLPTTVVSFKPGTAASKPGTAASKPSTAASKPSTAASKPGTADSAELFAEETDAEPFVIPRIPAIDPVENFKNAMEPDGYGIKTFADGSIYVGGFLQGKFSTDDRGVLSRPSGLNYEGTWVGGLKHGKGSQIYADHSVYTGEFANGFEHGEGRIVFADGSHFHGRFRFGRRDGPGQMTVGLEAVRRNFRDKENLLKEGMPMALEAEPEGRRRDETEEDALNPPSLLDAATDAVAYAMTKSRAAVRSDKLQRRLSDFLKHKLVRTFFDHMRASGRPSAAAFEEIMSRKAFTMHREMVVSNIRMKYDDLDILLFFISANTALERLELCANHLSSPGVGLLGKQLAGAPRYWPNLSHLSLAFNQVDSSSMQVLVIGLNHMSSLRVLNLSGCSIRSNTAHILALHLAHEKHLREVNLAFNYLGSMGAMSMATTIAQNRSITSLNLRHNDLGYSGGAAIAEALRSNYMMKSLCLVDNGIGEEIMATISGRLRCSLKGVIESVRASETDIPAFYVEGRFDDWKPRVSNLVLQGQGQIEKEEKEEEEGEPEAEAGDEEQEYEDQGSTEKGQGHEGSEETQHPQTQISRTPSMQFEAAQDFDETEPDPEPELFYEHSEDGSSGEEY